MNLSEIVFLRNAVQESLDTSGYQNELEKNLDKLNFLLENANEHYSAKIQHLITEHKQKIAELEKDVQEKEAIVEELNREIFNLTKKFFEGSYQTEWCVYLDVDAIRQVKVMVLADGAEAALISRINLYSTWEYPALEIGCRDGQWTKYLVSSDPLYIVDRDQAFLTSTANKFTSEYQARLRKYLMTDFQINGLPENQFGFIFSFNFFNYLGFDTIKQLLKQAFNWLRPGGVFLFTYNNADLSTSAGLSECHFMSYVPKSMLIPMVESIGFEIVSSPDYLPSTSWIEIKKPGTLRTVKAHQALGEIKYY